MPNIDLVQVVFLFAILLISLSVHEAAHAWSADRLGDSTARLSGRVSVNPLVHVDPLGTIATGLLFAVLEAGAGGLQREAGVPAVLVYLIEAVIIIVVLLSDAIARRRGDGRF